MHISTKAPRLFHHFSATRRVFLPLFGSFLILLLFPCGTSHIKSQGQHLFLHHLQKRWDSVKTGQDSARISTQAGSRKNSTPKISIPICLRRDRREDRMSTRTCSFFSSVVARGQQEHRAEHIPLQLQPRVRTGVQDLAHDRVARADQHHQQSHPRDGAAHAPVYRVDQTRQGHQSLHCFPLSHDLSAAFIHRVQRLFAMAPPGCRHCVPPTPARRTAPGR